MTLLPCGGYHLAVGSTEMGNGSVTSHRQLAASVLGVRADDIDIITTAERSPALELWLRVKRWYSRPRRSATTSSPLQANTRARLAQIGGWNAAMWCRAIGEYRSRTCAPPAAERGIASKRSERRIFRLAPQRSMCKDSALPCTWSRVRSGFCGVCTPRTSRRLINPMQCRGQIDGAIAMGIGWVLTENMIYDATGHMVNAALRNYRIPAFADIPRTELFFADTYDSIGPLGAKSQGECAINPVAPALANAVKNATGVRFCHLPLTPDHIFDRLVAVPERG
jgi:putative selenate reductase molybdopterin-binding subunit